MNNQQLKITFNNCVRVNNGEIYDDVGKTKL